MLKKLTLLFLITIVASNIFSQNVRPSKDWKLGVQLWTFNTSSFYTAIKKADSCKLKYVEAFPGQSLQEGSNSEFGPALTVEERKTVKEFLHKKGITITSFGVIVARTKK